MRILLCSITSLLILGGKTAQAATPTAIGPTAYAQDLAAVSAEAFWNEWPDVDPLVVPWRVKSTANPNQERPFIPNQTFDPPEVASSRILEIEAEGTALFLLDDRAPARIRRRNADQSGFLPLWSMVGQGMGTGRNLTLGGDWVVWADTKGIYRGRKDGVGDRELVTQFVPAKTPSSAGLDVQASGDTVWWVDRSAVAHILRSKNMNTGVENAFGPLPTSVGLLQRKAGFLYFILNQNRLYRIQEDLVGLEMLLEEVRPISGFVPDTTAVYYGLDAHGGASVKRLTLNTLTAQVLCAIGPRATKFALSGNFLFWHSLLQQQIYRLNLASSNTPVDVDLGMAGLEITQGIQSLVPMESMDLYRGKETWVRAYPTFVSGSGADVVATTMLLHATGPAGPLPGSPLRPTTPVLDVYRGQNPASLITVSPPGSNVVQKPLRDVLNRSFNFVLPASWLQGTYTLTADVNPADAAGGRALAESIVGNNTLARAVSFSTITPRIEVACPGVRVATATGVLSSSYPLFEMGQIARRLTHLLPIAQVEMSRRPFLPRTYPWTMPNHGDDLANALHERYPLETYGSVGVGRRRFYAVITPVGIDNIIGQAPYNSTASWNVFSMGADAPSRPTVSTPQTAVVLAHEFGHNMNLGHPGCTPAETAGFGWGNPSYPYPVNQFGPAGANRFHWLDILTGDVLAPTEGADLMSYCRPVIPSDYVWRQCFPLITGANWVPGTGQTTSGALVRIAAGFSASGAMTRFPPCLVLQREWFTPEFLSEIWNVQSPHFSINGTHRFVFRSETNAVLSEVKFNPHDAHPLMAHGSTQNVASQIGTAFSLLVPEVIGTKALEIYNATNLVARREISKFAPTVSLSSPVAGTQADKSLTISWNAGDLDGDTMEYIVQYSADDGQTWSLLADQLNTPSFTTEELRELPSSNQARIKVLATDGWHTTEAISDRFVVAPRKPEVAILEPTAEQIFQTGTAIRFEGLGYDPDELGIPPEALQWSLAGRPEAGIGPRWSVTDLPPGNYTVTLTVYDLTQQSASTSLNFTVSDRFAPPAPPVTQPTLMLAQSPAPSTISLCWDDWAENFRLQTSEDLAGWQDVQPLPTRSEGKYRSNQPTTATRAFYRLVEK